MNILYINHYAGSPALGMEYRPYHLAREWVRAGHAVQMLAANFSHVRTVQPQAAEETVDGVRYHWVATPPYRGNGWARMRNITTFLAQVWQDTPHWVQHFRPDVVIASSTYPMDIWVAQRIAKMAKAKLVYEVHDLWPLSPIELSGMSPWHPFALLCQKAEDDAYRLADVVVSMLPKVQAHMQSRGLDLNKLHIVPNGIDDSAWHAKAEPLRPDVAQALARAAQGHATVVGYAGSMGLPNALDVLLDAAALLQQGGRGSQFAFVLVGDGHEQARLAQRVAAQGLQQVQFLPPIPKAQIPSFLAALNLAYIGWQPSPIYRFGIAPNKLLDYMAAACPVLHAVQAGNDPVAESGCGISVAPGSAQAVVDGLLQMAALTPKQRRVMGERGRKHVLIHHTYAVLAKRFLQAVG